MKSTKKTKNIIKIVIIATVIILLGILYLKINNNTIELNIKNSTDKNITNLKLNYTGLENDITIPTIKKNESIKFNVKIDESFSEGAMKLYYTENNEYKEVIVIGYFEKGYNEKVNLNINQKNGNLDIKIE